MKLYVYENRIKSGLSMQELSDQSGVAKSYIQRMEEGNANPTIDIMCKIARALKVEVKTLYSCD